MIKKYGVSREHDVACAAHSLRHAIRELADDTNPIDRVGLSLAASIADALADALSRHNTLARLARERDEQTDSVCEAPEPGDRRETA